MHHTHFFWMKPGTTVHRLVSVDYFDHAQNVLFTWLLFMLTPSHLESAGAGSLF